MDLRSVTGPHRAHFEPTLSARLPVTQVFAPDGRAGINFTEMQTMIEDVADVEGAAPRWLVPATLRNPYDDAKNTTVTLLIIDTELEREAKLGRSWDFRQLGRTEAIAVSASLPCLAVSCERA